MFDKSNFANPSAPLAFDRRRLIVTSCWLSVMSSKNVCTNLVNLVDKGRVSRNMLRPRCQPSVSAKTKPGGKDPERPTLEKLGATVGWWVPVKSPVVTASLRLHMPHLRTCLEKLVSKHPNIIKKGIPTHRSLLSNQLPFTERFTLRC